MGIYFRVGKSWKDIEYSDGGTNLIEEFIDFLYDGGLIEKYELDIIYELDPYGDAEFGSHEILHIAERCEMLLKDDLLQYYDGSKDGTGDYDEENPFDATRFLTELVGLCHMAIEKGLHLFAIGD